MVSLVSNCGGPGLLCPGSPESIAASQLRSVNKDPLMGGKICSCKCHNNPPGPCSRDVAKLFPKPGQSDPKVTFEAIEAEHAKKTEVWQ